MPRQQTKVRRRPLDHLRQKMWAVPAWFRLCVLRRSGPTRAQRRRARGAQVR
ncbi:MAG TPA: hypothetical protein VGQ42_16125 [Candidatus Dormibacteraeota bacterium]|jgi:hypothetical protein|nr:hypothetical protein [Candidatus Dormibacteraeota bacterium]